MNLRRGLFRVWLVLSALFIIAVFAFSYDSLYQEFKNKYFVWKPETFTLLLPTDCSDARGKKSAYNMQQENALIDAQAKRDKAEGTKSEKMVFDYDYTTSRDDSFCWYELPKFRALFPEYKDLDDGTLGDKLYDKAGIPIKHYTPWMLLFKTLIFAIGIPLFVLVLGKSLLWAGTGFKK